MTVGPDAAPLPGEPELPEDELAEDWIEREPPTEAELLGLCPDPFAGPPDGADAWLGDLSAAELDALADDWDAAHPAAAQDGIGAGFLRDLPGDCPRGFAVGGPLDQLAPDPVLAGFAEDAYLDGLGSLSDDELVGMLCATRRLSSWQAAMEFAAVAELGKRRAAQAGRPGWSRITEHTGAELAAALMLTGRSAEALLGLSRDLARLPQVLTALFAGRIDRARAAVFAAELAQLDLEKAAEIVAKLIRDAEKMTTGQLRARLRALVLSADPGAARKRAERASRDARVETWPENSGNAALGGRELPASEVLAADARLTAIAKALQQAGAEGGIDQLRAAVFTALLTGRDPMTLAPSPSPGHVGDSLPGLAGSVNLTMPISSWLGQSDAPGEVAGFGPVDAGTCRDLASRLGTEPGTHWCLTLTGNDGQAVAHGCSRTGPGHAQPGKAPRATGPPLSPDPRHLGLPKWLASLKIQWLERDPCGHLRRVSSYQASRMLRNLVIVRHRTCSFPGCRRPARRCDADHTTPFDQGGITCECNLAPLCRRHHQAKQAPGWRLTQPEPGVLIWTTPHGRSYTSRPEPYPV
jgi:hypothetical protein